jgi:hypothetical protein
LSRSSRQLYAANNADASRPSAAAEDAGKGGGHRGGHHHGGRGGHGRGGGVFYDRAPDVVVVREDCPPGFYYDEFGDCRGSRITREAALCGRAMGQNAGAVADLTIWEREPFRTCFDRPVCP